MRNLTIVRQKTFVASLAKVYIYIEDLECGDTAINGVMCRLLGTVQSGDAQTFQIDNESRRIYATVGKTSRNYCNDLYILPEGDEDITLSGKNHYNPATGNPFRFDGNDNEIVKESRKKNSKKAIIIFVVAILVGSFVGVAIGTGFFGILKNQPKKFTVDEMTITLTNEFEADSQIGFKKVFYSKEVLVMILKTSFYDTSREKDYTPEYYRQVIVDSNEVSNERITDNNGIPGFIYEYDEFCYFAYVYKSDNAFWTVMFVTEIEDASKFESKILDWASSVKFD